MASIKISELRPAGSEFFQDSESFLNELNDREIVDVNGGFVFAFNGSLGVTVSAQSVNGNSLNANSLFNVNTAVVG